MTKSRSNMTVVTIPILIDQHTLYSDGGGAWKVSSGAHLQQLIAHSGTVATPPKTHPLDKHSAHQQQRHNESFNSARYLVIETVTPSTPAAR